jgi:N utilization substance protein B
MEDSFPNWLDDTEVISFAVTNFIEQLASDKPAKWQTDLSEENKFANDLLNNAYHNEEYITNLITPKLKNWDKDRLAQVDLLLMKLALTEMLYFPNIPVKVSINEYIDVAKQYSTPKSGDFINGILDRIMKELQEQNLIKKTGRGWVEK